MIDPVTFFRVVSLHSRYMLGALAAAGVWGLLVLVVDGSRGSEAVAPVVLLQMFAASSGFAVPARRGHFDLLLTGGASRARIALTHLLMSILPGAGVWVAVAVGEAMRTGAPGRAFSTGTVVAMLVVSVLSWAATVPLPRLSGGIGWLLLMALALAGPIDGGTLMAAIRSGAISDVTGGMVYLLCPPLLVGAASVPLASLLPACVTAVVAGAAAAAWIVRADVPLESAQ